MSNPNILVIGNGFDLYHGLKTNYIDFVKFSEDLVNKKKRVDGRKLAINNSFIRCFIKVATENQSWIDCEKEIEIIITMILKILNDRKVFDGNSLYIEKNSTSLKTYEFERLRLMTRFCVKSDARTIFFNDKYFKIYEGIDRNSIMETLKHDLDDLIKLFKYYLEKKVINQPITKRAKQIQNLSPDYVINFNYTNTYEHYGISRQDVCYIHGSVQDNNMVLGIKDIDETDINSIYFKKFFQRLQKHTDIIQWNKFGESQGLAETMREATTYFFGHSLSKTDGDLIRSIYENSRKMVIFYLEGHKDYEQKIISLIDTLGKETVIQGMYAGQIEFIPIK